MTKSQNTKNLFMVFLDRDGTLIKDTGYIKDPSEIKILPNTIEGLKKITSLGAAVIMITNQSGISRGYFDLPQVVHLNEVIMKRLSASGCKFADIQICPHGPNDGCGCRKPKTGLLRKASKSLNIPLNRSVIVGDRETDIAAGLNAGIPGILISSGKSNYNFGQYSTAADMLEAAYIIERLAIENSWILDV